MHIGIFTLLAVLYASTHVAAQSEFACFCETNGVVDNTGTELCCEAATGGFFDSPCLVPAADLPPFQTCCIESMGQGDSCEVVA
ncbi:hypothetical protein B0H16DRAFT_1510210 [Mycena metata]|uniref:Uncharacterized protein n=1 Tax=Mycena metata TaxID=1033252 RepID=A0AAD7NT73_9AGAR|nr:hypothetical protein B0H16DRAFT_1510210 [Mycena metata]